MQPPVQVQMYLGINNCIQKFFLPPNNLPVERLDKESAEATTIDCFKSCLHQSAVAVRRRDTPHWEFVDYVPDSDTILHCVSKNLVLIVELLATG